MKLLPLLCLVGCLPDISASIDPGPLDTAPDVLIDPGTGDEPFVAELEIDATDHELWQGLDLDALDPSADADGPSFDLAFRRFEVKLNGGVSGDGGVEAVVLDAVPFEEISEVPACCWITDEADADGDTVPEYALLTWYDYDYDTHQLAPADRTYVIRTTEQAVFRLAFVSYYNENGTPARIALRVGPLSAPEER